MDTMKQQKNKQKMSTTTKKMYEAMCTRPSYIHK